jgi:Lar family restriction alleviation protein
MTDHKPCPFCGSDDIFAIDDEYGNPLLRPWRIECESCETRGPSAETEDEAWDKWDNREDGK